MESSRAEVLETTYSSEELDVNDDEEVSAEELVFWPLELEALPDKSSELLENSSYSDE